MPRPARIELWTDVECNSGTRQSWIEPIVGTQEMALDNTDVLRLAIPDDGDVWDAVTDLALLKVIRVTTHPGSGSETVYEWRIQSIKDGEGRRQRMIHVEADPLLYDLRNGMVRTDTTGGRPTFNQAVTGLTPEEYIDTYVLPALTDVGIDWVSRGTVTITTNPGETYDINLTRYTALELLQEIAEKTDTELRLRRNGSTDYKIDLLEQTGSGSATPRVQFGRNLIEIARERNMTGYATRIYAMGKRPSNASENSTIGFAAWDVTGTATGNVVTLAAPATGPGPIAFDDQLNGKYLYTPTGTLIQVSDSTASSDTVTLATSHSLVTGDRVTFFNDASGSLLTVLTNPAAEATKPIKTLTRVYSEHHREERNWVPNPQMENWATGNTPDGWASSVSGSWSYSTIVPKIAHRLMTATAGTVTGLTVAPQTSTGGVVSIAGFATGHTIRAGDVVSITRGATVKYYAMTTAVANASGIAAPKVYKEGTDVLYSETSTGTATHVIPGLTGATAGSSNAICLTITNNPSPDTDGAWISTPAITLPYVSTDTVVRAAIGYSLYTYNGCTINSGPTTGETGPPVAYLQHATSGATYASGLGATGTYATGLHHEVLRTGSYTMTANTRMVLKVRGPYKEGSGGLLWDPVTFIRWAQISITPDSAVPFVDGSHGTALWQYANSILTTAQLPQYITCKIRDLSDVDGYTLSEEDITLGGNIRVVSDKLGLDTDVRVVSVIMDLVDPTNMQVVLDTLRGRVTTRLKGALATAIP